MKKINNDLIRSFHPCYDPSEKNIPDNETLPVFEWVEKYRGVVPAKDIIWLICRNEFMNVRDLRLFAVWCAREALKLVENPDARSIDACNVAERFSNGDATMEEMEAAWVTASIAESAAASAAAYAACAASCDAACAAAYAACAASCDAASAANEAAWEAQLNQLLTYFK